jgi:hypothetical protein
MHTADQYIEIVHLKNIAADSVLQHQRSFPKCRMIASMNGDRLTLVATKKEEIDVVKIFIDHIDLPTITAHLTLYCLLIQEQYLDDFLSSLMNNGLVLQTSWKEVMKSLLFEMQRHGKLVIVAAPRIAIQAGHDAYLKATEEFFIKSNISKNKEERRQLGIELKLNCISKPNDYFLFNIHLHHYTSPLSQTGQQYLNRDELQTIITGKRGDVVFLGSVGRWSSVEEEGNFFLLNLLPQSLNPSLHHNSKTSSQMILMAHIE